MPDLASSVKSFVEVARTSFTYWRRVNVGCMTFGSLDLSVWLLHSLVRVCLVHCDDTHPRPVSYPALAQVLLVVRLHEVVRLEEGVVQQLLRGPPLSRVLVQAFLQ